MNIEIGGYYYPPNSSERIEATAEFSIFENENGELSGNIHITNQTYPIETIKISEPLGTMPRFIQFSNKAQFEFSNHSRFAEIEQSINQIRKAGIKGLSFESWVKHMESKKRWIVLSCLLMCLVLFGGFRYGLPLGAKLAAIYTPDYVSEKLDKQAVEILENYALEPSLITNETQARYLSAFDGLRKGEQATLLFRRGADIGANAFALPGSTIIVTDELIRLSESENEVLAVLAHELAHVRERHSLQRLYRDIGAAAIIAVIIGDASAVVESVLALPAVLLELGFSRQFEYEADAIAVEILHNAGLPADRLGTMLLKLELTHKNKTKPSIESKTSDNEASDSTETLEEQAGIDWDEYLKKIGIDKEKLDEINIDDLGFEDYLSTHPDTKKRILRIKQLSERYNKNQ